MNINKIRKEHCFICNSENMSYYQYGNHCNTYNVKYLKYFIAEIVSKIFHVKFLKFQTKLLFSPLYKIARCNTCGYGHYKRVISENLLKSYYESVYWQSAGLSKDKFADINLFLNDDRANGQFLFVKDELEKKEKINILEIGGGAVLTSRYIRHDFTNKQVFIDVVEPGKGWEKYYIANKINKVADFFPFSLNKYYGYIHTSHWLEHVIDLEATLVELYEKLEEGGLLFVEVPNCTDEYYKLDVGDIPHIHFFTEDSLVMLFTKYGFELIRSGTYGFTNNENYLYRKNPNNISNNIYLESKKSVKENIKRENGEILRALFKKK